MLTLGNKRERKLRIFPYATALCLCASMAAQPVLAMSTDEACANVGRAAEAVMQARQNGMALQTVLEKMNGAGFGAEGKDGFRAMIMMAYDQPRFNTEENKQQAINDFRDQVQLFCMKGGN
ncbi:hypothetical protein LB577_20060 [Mesorhizobium sp. B283B1A]|uniref:hypothetical protein n=1 Tax=Mesorhizobium TaxID=68287 RepID=UPI001CD0E48D|nr:MULTISPECIES: hypothetical protein [Mesorhizobium]MCA0049217.1 hypothetical protein [Mesorhizobium sp. B283B1A]UQS64372.1 hypothetical protein M5D98_30505 [Mesorhizobium opportunistum]